MLDDDRSRGQDKVGAEIGREPAAVTDGILQHARYYLRPTAAYSMQRNTQSTSTGPSSGPLDAPTPAAGGIDEAAPPSVDAIRRIHHPSKDSS